MPNISIIRGDSYAIRRPLYTYTIVDEDGAPFDLAGCTVRTTYKIQKSLIEADPDDQTAVLRHSLSVDMNGVATPSGLYLQGAAAAGIIVDRITSTESKLFQPNTTYISDLQLTDALGEIFTWLWDDGVVAIDGVTNRDS